MSFGVLISQLYVFLREIFSQKLYSFQLIPSNICCRVVAILWILLIHVSHLIDNLEVFLTLCGLFLHFWWFPIVMVEINMNSACNLTFLGKTWSEVV